MPAIRARFVVVFLILVFFVFCHRAAAQTQTTANSAHAVGPHVLSTFANRPLSFEPNRGQTSKAVQWIARGSGTTVFLTGHDAVLELSKIPRRNKLGDPLQPIENAALRMNLVGANAKNNSIAEQPQSGTVNYITGKSPADWQQNVPLFGRIRLPQIYRGIDLVYYGTQGRLEYDFSVAPGADPAAIRLVFSGATPSINEHGDLLLPLDGEQVSFGRPIVFQTVDGRRRLVDAAFHLATNHEVTFKVGRYDRTRELVIDPVLLFAGTLGSGDQPTLPQGLALDTSGEMILTGRTADLTFPITSGSFQTGCGGVIPNGTPRCGPGGGGAAFVTKISADGTQLVYSTYLHGGQGAENGIAVAADSSGTAYVVGTTLSNDFPVTSDAYSTYCSPGGINYNFSTSEYTAIGSTCYGQVGGGYVGFNQPSMFLVKLDSTGTKLLYGTFFGGSGNDEPNGIALDAKGNIYIGGSSSSNLTNYPSGNLIGFPIVGGYQSNGVSGGFSATISKFTNDGHKLLYSSFLGSMMTEGDDTYEYALAVGQNGIAFVGGTTQAIDFPTTPGAIKTACIPASGSTTSCQEYGGWVSAINTTKTGAASVVYSTLINGDQAAAVSSLPETTVQGLAADSSNHLYLAGHTYSDDFPTTTGSFQPSCIGDNSLHCDTGFLSELNTTGTAFLWSTFYGGATSDSGSSAYAVALDDKSRVYLYGSSQGGTDLPTVDPVQVPNAGGDKIYIAAFSPNGSQLLFGTRFGSTIVASNEEPINYNGIALDAAGNIYFGGQTNSSDFPTTPGTYATPYTNDFFRGFFGKISPVEVPTSRSLQFIPVTPCRVADTRNPDGPFGGPGIAGGYSREFDIPNSACSIPSTAVAYSLNVTVVPNGELHYITLWPSGQTLPTASTLNSLDGRIKANAAIVPAGTNGGVSVFAYDATQVILDIDGYFVPAGTASALAFYPVTPCRLVDTRNAAGPLGGPSITGGTSRSFPLLSSACGLPATAQAYSLNVTAVPHTILHYLTAWPTGQPLPVASTLNALTGTDTANAAIVPAGTGGAVSIFVYDDADVVLDVNGYFAPTATGGLSLYTLSPCRVLDTRNAAGAFSGTLPVAVETGPCPSPSTAQAYVLNATVVPSGSLPYITLWPNGETEPVVSTLNAVDGAITSNLAIVPTTNGNIDAFAYSLTQLILDTTGYFAP